MHRRSVLKSLFFTVGAALFGVFAGRPKADAAAKPPAPPAADDVCGGDVFGADRLPGGAWAAFGRGRAATAEDAAARLPPPRPGYERQSGGVLQTPDGWAWEFTDVQRS